MSNIERDPNYGVLQEIVDDLYREDDAPYLEQIDENIAFKVAKLDIVLAGEAADIPEELLRIIRMLPPGEYTRGRLCKQLNSAITGHAWGQVYGTVE